MDLVQMLSIIAAAVAVQLASRLRYPIMSELSLPLVLFAIAGIADGLVTIHYAYLNPDIEANIIVKPFLTYQYIIVVGFFIWVFGWLTLINWVWTNRFYAIATLIPLSLAVGHAWGFTTWLHRMSPGMIAETIIVTLVTVVLLYCLFVGRYDEKKAKQQRR